MKLFYLHQQNTGGQRTFLCSAIKHSGGQVSLGKSWFSKGMLDVEKAVSSIIFQDLRSKSRQVWAIITSGMFKQNIGTRTVVINLKTEISNCWSFRKCIRFVIIAHLTKIHHIGLSKCSKTRNSQSSETNQGFWEFFFNI